MSCFKCGHMGHWARNCFLNSTQQSQSRPKERSLISCTRCGRTGHWIQDCFARSTIDGQLLPVKNSTEVHRMFRGPLSEIGQISDRRQISRKDEGQVSGKRKRQDSRRSGVYVLQYQNGNIYVGKSNDIDARIRQHASRSVKCTSGWQGSPTEIKPITPYMDDFESWERNETLELMSKHGVEKVRGWMYTSQHLSQETVDSIDAQLCEKYDLCRSCGGKGHFMSACPLNSTKGSYPTNSTKGSYYADDSSYFSDSSNDGDCFSESSSYEDPAGSYKRYRDDSDSYDDGNDGEFDDFDD